MLLTKVNRQKTESEDHQFNKLTDADQQNIKRISKTNGPIQRLSFARRDQLCSISGTNFYSEAPTKY